ncbi:helix-turn-helix domain-containing protein [Comamonas sp. MYb69]|uniref:helix-turn-helix domain-containing protein n=1 Tax=Comamonas sp. MYb69 TaxID=1848650 RepID=UPI0030959714
MHTIELIRERLGVTQKELAQGIGCTQSNIGHYSRGQAIPAERAVKLISFARGRGLSLTLDQVYGIAALPDFAANTQAPICSSSPIIADCDAHQIHLESTHVQV